MKEKMDPWKEIDRLIEALGLDNPQTIDENRREIGSAGLDGETVWRGIKSDIDAGIAASKREEFLE